MSDDDKPRDMDELKRLGLGSWLPDERFPGHELYFGMDRSAPSKWQSTLRPMTLRERISGAWRGMVNGWRGAQ